MTHESVAETFELFIAKEGGINKACKSIEKKLKGKWTWKYLYHVYRGTVTPSDKLLRKLLRINHPIFRKKRYRMITEALSKEQYDSWPKTMEERRIRLDRKD